MEDPHFGSSQLGNPLGADPGGQEDHAPLKMLKSPFGLLHYE